MDDLQDLQIMSRDCTKFIKHFLSLVNKNIVFSIAWDEEKNKFVKSNYLTLKLWHISSNLLFLSLIYLYCTTPQILNLRCDEFGQLITNSNKEGTSTCLKACYYIFLHVTVTASLTINGILTFVFTLKITQSLELLNCSNHLSIYSNKLKRVLVCRSATWSEKLALTPILKFVGFSYYAATLFGLVVYVALVQLLPGSIINWIKVSTIGYISLFFSLCVVAYHVATSYYMGTILLLFGGINLTSTLKLVTYVKQSEKNSLLRRHYIGYFTASMTYKACQLWLTMFNELMGTWILPIVLLGLKVVALISNFLFIKELSYLFQVKDQVLRLFFVALTSSLTNIFCTAFYASGGFLITFSARVLMSWKKPGVLSSFEKKHINSIPVLGLKFGITRLKRTAAMVFILKVIQYTNKLLLSIVINE